MELSIFAILFFLNNYFCNRINGNFNLNEKIIYQVEVYSFVDTCPKEVAISLITKDGNAEEDLLFLTEDSFLVENGEPEECYEEEKKKYENNDFKVKTKSNHVVVFVTTTNRTTE